MSEVQEGKSAAIVAYITIIGCLIAITMNMEPKNAFARFHIRQAFGIHVLFHALAILLTYSGMVYLSIPIYIFYLVIWVFGFLQALNEKTKPLPFLGVYFQKWFTFIS
ncbi:hypothetical protein [Flagellimonas zhangzhouensis]|uniref:DUF4870 domain-containing protein n=1 Tax=Flagellimonas zhangzhouensis TaxID=1073328 RepID=A0A1H2SS77_9FLAO|nr:hypothetical protein [Allomuricauda zhangzhouensis]SDQ78412.1 hypothetical protein SAMN05216294_2589 [Allomuricauda zhangzhouensis]SDW34305.1 hypothetical protein SAMN04487892_1230 [Allomuricauda zhangzhouensis]